jgi:hypothetical protein
MAMIMTTAIMVIMPTPITTLPMPCSGTYREQHCIGRRASSECPRLTLVVGPSFLDGCWWTAQAWRGALLLLELLVLRLRVVPVVLLVGVVVVLLLLLRVSAWTSSSAPLRPCLAARRVWSFELTTLRVAAVAAASAAAAWWRAAARGSKSSHGGALFALHCVVLC